MSRAFFLYSRCEKAGIQHSTDLGVSTSLKANTSFDGRVLLVHLLSNSHPYGFQAVKLKWHTALLCQRMIQCSFLSF